MCHLDRPSGHPAQRRFLRRNPPRRAVVRPSGRASQPLAAPALRHPVKRRFIPGRKDSPPPRRPPPRGVPPDAPAACPPGSPPPRPCVTTRAGRRRGRRPAACRRRAAFRGRRRARPPPHCRRASSSLAQLPRSGRSGRRSDGRGVGASCSQADMRQARRAGPREGGGGRLASRNETALHRVTQGRRREGQRGSPGRLGRPRARGDSCGASAFCGGCLEGRSMWHITCSSPRPRRRGAGRRCSPHRLLRRVWRHGHDDSTQTLQIGLPEETSHDVDLLPFQPRKQRCPGGRG